MSVDQTQKEDLSFAGGLSFEVSKDDGSSFEDMGIMDDGATITYNYDAPDVEFGNKEDPDRVVKNQTLAVAPSNLLSFDTVSMEALSNGLLTRTAVAGTPVAGAVQNVAQGNWAFNKGILLTGQNADGTAPTINSVTGSIDGPVGADDYDLALLPGGWHLIPRDGTVFTTEAQSIAINTDYTPGEYSTLAAGTAAKVMAPVWVRLTHYTDSAKTAFDWRIDIYRVFLDSGMVITKLGAKSGNNYDNYTVAITGKRDSGRVDGSQLFLITQY